MIPVLLLRNGGLVKTTRFGAAAYVGDPLNAVRIFNNFRADELVLLDVDATREGRTIPLEVVRSLSEEARMPISFGGGIGTIEQIRSIIAAGAERVVLGSAALERPSFVAEAASTFGSSTIVVCMDVRREVFGRYRVTHLNGTKRTDHGPADFGKRMEECGAGELIVQSVDRDGTMSGYDLELVEAVSRSVTIPVVALGGAGSVDDMRKAHESSHASAVAAGSMFVFHGSRRGVLISYPDPRTLANPGRSGGD
ncbi:MAG: AglZ/HisF2 family acetamidino modification protein [Polyangiaceae bacterium]